MFSASTTAWKRRDPALAGGRGQVLEQHRADAAALVGVGDDERDLGLVGARRALVAADGDDLAAELGDERDPVVVVDVGEPVRGRARGMRG